MRENIQVYCTDGGDGCGGPIVGLDACVDSAAQIYR
jgi:hypothetical protein